MRRYRDRPIGHKIAIIIVVGMLSATALAIANFIAIDRRYMHTSLSQELSVLARITAARSAAAIAFDDRDNAHQNLLTLSLKTTIQHACIFDAEGLLFARYERERSGFGGCPALLQPGLDVSDMLGEDTLAVVEPVHRNRRPLGSILIVSDLSPLAEHTRRAIVTGLGVSMVALLVAFVMTRRMQAAIVRPITSLAGLMDGVNKGNDLSLRAPVHSDDEVGHLVRSFNHMLQIIEHRNRDLHLLYRSLVEKAAEAESTLASLQSNNERIKTLFASAAHDLRQPLQAAVIFVDALNAHPPGEQRDAILRRLKTSLDNLRHLCNDILDVSRYGYDAQVTANEPVSLPALLGRMQTEFEALAQQKGLSLRLRGGEYTVLAHGALLERILRNLLTNAIRYTDRGGVLLGCRRRGEHLAIEVWDTGRGIPHDKLNAIFGQFVQVRAEDHHVGGGFGLGLALVKQFADTLGYKVSVHSWEGRGSCFRLRVPLAPRLAPPAASSGMDTPPPLGAAEPTTGIAATADTPTIALVDDTAAVREAIALMLRNWGLAVQQFDSVAALEAYLPTAARPPTLLITDFELSAQTTGLDAVAAARRHLGDALPALIVSASENTAIWDTIAAAGLPALRKPLQAARLRAMINHLTT